VKIAIVGCGAMGSVYAGLFASAGHEVWAIDRWAEHVAAMKKNGLRLEGKSGDRTVKVHATTDAKEAGPCDLVVLATKAMHVAPAAESVKSLLGKDTPVLSIQNGLGGPDTAADILGRERVMVGVVGGFGASMKGPGHAHHNGMELVRLGEFGGPITPRLKKVEETWAGAGFKVKVFDDIDQLVWEKLICNCAYSGPCGLMEVTIKQVMDDPDLSKVSAACASEEGREARLFRPGRLRARLRLEDPERASVGAARPDGGEALGDRRHQRLDTARGQGGRRARARERDHHRTGQGEGSEAGL